MKKLFLKINRRCLKLAILAICVLPEIASAQYFTYHDGDLLLGFRKISGSSYDLVVDVGSVTNYLALPAGTTIPINQFSPGQLSDAFNNYNNLQWSASAAWTATANWSGFPYHTYWISVPRSNPIVQTTPPQRATYGAQGLTFQFMAGIGTDAAQMSSQFIGGATNADNNTVLVRELTGGDYDGYDYHYFAEDPQNAALGDFRGSVGYNAEYVTPANFTNTVAVSDLYQSVPSGHTDPITGTTSGAAYYVGYFALKADGSMTFTRASTTPPAAPRITSITRVNGKTTVSFTTVNGAIYALLSDDSAGLSVPMANWQVPGALIGDGNTDSLSDTTTATNQFYLVGAGN